MANKLRPLVSRWGTVTDPSAIRSSLAHLRLYKKFRGDSSSDGLLKSKYHVACIQDLARKNRLLTSAEKNGNAKLASLSAHFKEGGR